MEVWMTGATARALLFLHDKDLLVIGEADGTVRVLYEKTRGPTTVLKAHAGSVTALVSVRSGAQKNLFVSAGMDRVIRLWVPDIEKDGHFRVLQELRISPGDEPGDGDDTENEELISLPKVRRSALAPAAATTGDALFCMCDGRRVLVWGPPEDGDAEDRVAVLDVVEMKNTPALMKLFDLRGHSGGVKFVESDGDDEIVTIDVLDTLRVFSLRSRSLEATVKRERDTPAVSCALCIRQHSQRMTTPLLLLGREDGSLDVRAWPTAGGARMHLLRRHSGYSVHLLYWYKSTNTDALHAGASHTCSMSANSSSVPALIPRYSVYLLYKYKSTNTDT
jgi:WD40 repeat protein